MATQTLLDPSTLISQLHWRYATKKFDATRAIPPDVWSALEDTLVLTPSSFGLQPWKFLVVENKPLRGKLLPALWNQHQVVEASHFVVFTIKKNMNPADVQRLIDRIVSVRRVPTASLEGYKHVMNGFLTAPSDKFNVNEWSRRQVYIALGNLMTAAAVLGIDACPMEGLDPAQYDEILNLNGTDYQTVVACALGYRSPDDPYAAAPKVRYEKKDVVQHL